MSCFNFINFCKCIDLHVIELKYLKIKTIILAKHIHLYFSTLLCKIIVENVAIK